MLAEEKRRIDNLPAEISVDIDGPKFEERYRTMLRTEEIIQRYRKGGASQPAFRGLMDLIRGMKPFNGRAFPPEFNLPYFRWLVENAHTPSNTYAGPSESTNYAQRALMILFDGQTYNEMPNTGVDYFVQGVNKLIVDRRISDFLKNCKKRLAYVDVMLDSKVSTHANALVFDTETKEAERFEPHGADATFYDRETNGLLEGFTEHMGYKYVPPIVYCPRNIQNAAARPRWLTGGGWCQLISNLYLTVRVINPTYSRKMVMDYVEDFASDGDNVNQFGGFMKNAIERLVPAEYFADAGVPRQSFAGLRLSFASLPRPKVMFSVDDEMRLIARAQTVAQKIFHSVLLVVAKKNAVSDIATEVTEMHVNIDDGRLVVMPRTHTETQDDLLRHGQYYVVVEEREPPRVRVLEAILGAEYAAAKARPDSRVQYLDART